MVCQEGSVDTCACQASLPTDLSSILKTQIKEKKKKKNQAHKMYSYHTPAPWLAHTLHAHHTNK